MQETERSRTVRELGGEIWAELMKLDRTRTLWQSLDEVGDVLMGVLARHVGSTILNDTDLPVDPLP